MLAAREVIASSSTCSALDLWAEWAVSLVGAHDHDAQGTVDPADDTEASQLDERRFRAHADEAIAKRSVPAVLVYFALLRRPTKGREGSIPGFRHPKRIACLWRIGCAGAIRGPYHNVAVRSSARLDPLDLQRRIDGKDVIRVRGEHGPTALTGEQRDVGIDGIRRTGRTQHVAENARNSEREIYDLGLTQKESYRNLLPLLPTPDLRNHTSGGHEQRLLPGEEVDQADGHSVAPFDRYEEPRVEHHTARVAHAADLRLAGLARRP